MKKKLFLTAMCAIFIGLIIFLLYTIKNEKHSSLVIPNKDSNSGEHDIEMTVNISKQWLESDGSTGAEYDFYIYNNTIYNFKDWEIVVDLPKNSAIDSCWSGEYIIGGNKIYYTPDSNTNNIESGTIRTLGFVLRSPKGYKVSDAKISGTFVINYKESKSLPVIICLMCLWLVVISVFFIVEFRVKRYRERLERDSVIITQSITTFVNFVDAKDPYTKGHSSRVAIYSRELAKRMGLSVEEQEHIYYIALMHDVGKISIPDAILNKNGALDDEERQIIKSHTTRGGKMLETFTSLDGIIEGALYHHERFDGKGYPNGLAGNDIPLYARIICVADSYDAMSSNRCYRPHLHKEKILSELEVNSGTQFDPDIVIHMINMINDGFTDKIAK